MFATDNDAAADLRPEVSEVAQSAWRREHLDPIIVDGGVRAAAAARRDAEALLDAAVVKARRLRRSWAEIGAAAGMTGSQPTNAGRIGSDEPAKAHVVARGGNCTRAPCPRIGHDDQRGLLRRRCWRTVTPRSLRNWAEMMVITAWPWRSRRRSGCAAWSFRNGIVIGAVPVSADHQHAWLRAGRVQFADISCCVCRLVQVHSPDCRRPAVCQGLRDTRSIL